MSLIYLFTWTKVYNALLIQGIELETTRQKEWNVFWIIRCGNLLSLAEFSTWIMGHPVKFHLTDSNLLVYLSDHYTMRYTLILKLGFAYST